MAKMITKLELLEYNVMGSFTRFVNGVGVGLIPMRHILRLYIMRK